jgi:RimJ/RimL family protein N-acetyltransferase
MQAENPPERDEVTLRPWSGDDLPLLVRLLGDPGMTEHLGGPESPEKLRQRHERYTALHGSGRGQMFVIEVGPGGEPAGSIGYWEKEWQGETVWETGWSIVPEFQGRGIATRAALLAVAAARAEGTHRSIHAFPSVDNPASNAVCRKAGFILRGAFDFAYPPGDTIRCNDWFV